ncbi:MAG: thioredoxin family protein [Lachnospiraceae bacterium]|nr:thioredoxin family protein [Lachnospiraceae bacterium]
MTSKELVFNTLEYKPTPRAPWIPFAGAYASRLKGYTAQEMFQDGDKLAECMLEVNKVFKPDGQCCIFDLQIEAEILGCDLVWANDGPPSVASHPLAPEDPDDEDELPEIPCDCTIPTENDGRIPEIVKAMKIIKKEVGDETALYGCITGPFTLASHLRGSQIFMDMFDEDEWVQDLLVFTNKVAKKMADYFIEAGMDVIAVVDPLISQMSTAHFEEFCAEPFTDLFDHINEKGAKSAFFVCGDATKNIEVMCKTHCNSISVDENVNMQEAKAICDKYKIAIGGNIPLTTTMLHGTQMDNMKYCVDLYDSFENKTGLIIASGCDMPYGVPFENTIGCMQAVRETDSVREMVKNYVKEEVELPDVELIDYSKKDKPVLEAMTLDPATCAACTYMVKACDEAVANLGDAVEYHVYKYTVLEDIARYTKMGVEHLPSLYINGELVYSSIVPSVKELEEKLRSYIK